MRENFLKATTPEKKRILEDIVNMCNSQQLSFILQLVSPRLKKDPMMSLPDELCLRVSAASVVIFSGVLPRLLTP